VRNIFWGAVGVLIGIVLSIFGVIGLTSDVKCGDQVMKPGDTCVSVGNGGGTRNYDEQKSKNERLDWISLGAGVLFVAGSTWLVVSGVRDRRRRAAPVPPPEAS
jgi:hypothetical protein